MTRKLSILFLSIFSLIIVANASNPESDKKSNADKNVAKAGSAFCKCINNFMGELHPSLTTFTKNMHELGIDAAQQEFTQYLMTLSQDELSLINKDAEKMAQISGDNLLKNCKLTKYEKYLNDEKYNSKLLDFFEKNSDCELAKMFLEIGETID